MEELEFYWQKPRKKKDDEIRIEIPGFRKEEITATLTKKSISIRAEKRIKQIKKEGGIIQNEKFSRSFSTVLPLPTEINGDDYIIEIKDDAVLMKKRQKKIKSLK